MSSGAWESCGSCVLAKTSIETISKAIYWILCACGLPALYPYRLCHRQQPVLQAELALCCRGAPVLRR